MKKTWNTGLDGGIAVQNTCLVQLETLAGHF